jgi:hypothetical protein
MLEPEIRDVIIEALSVYATAHIKEIINKDSTTKKASTIAKEIIDSKIFDVTLRSKINGLTNLASHKGHQLKLFNDVQSIFEMNLRSSEELYSHMETVVKKIKTNSKKLTEQDTLLVDVYNFKNSNNLDELYE